MRRSDGEEFGWEIGRECTQEAWKKKRQTFSGIG